MAFNQLNIKIGAVATGLEKTLSQVEKRLNRFGRTMESVGRDLTARLTLPLAGVGVAAVKAFADFEKLTKGLEAIATEADPANKQLERLRKLALNPGISLEQAVAGSIRLQAVGQSAKDAEETLLQFSKAVALAGGTAEDLDVVTRQLSQIQSKGRILSEDFLVIAERVPAIGLALKTAFGTTNIEAIRASGVSATDFVKRLTEGIAQTREFQKVQGGLTNSIDNFRQSVNASLATLGQSIVKSIDLNKVLNDLSKFIANVTEGFSKLSPSTQKFIIVSAGIAAAIGPALLAIGSLVRILPLLGAGFTALTGPIGLAIAAVSTLILLLSQLDYKQIGEGLKQAFDTGPFNTPEQNKKLNLFGVQAGKQFKEGFNNELRGISALEAVGATVPGVTTRISPFVAAPKAPATPPKPPKPPKIPGAEPAIKSLEKLQELAVLNGSAFGVLAEQVDFSNIAIVKSQTAMDGSAEALERVAKNAQVWNEALAAGLIPLNAALTEQLEKQQERFQAVAGFISGTLQDAFSGFFDTVLSGGQNAFKAFGDVLKKIVAQLIKAVVTALALAAIFSIISGGAGGAISKLGLSGKGFGGLFGGLFKGISGFASGGLVIGPTLALVGEGAGTSRSNPEVIAPLDQLRALLGDVGGGGAFVASTRIAGDDLLLLVERAQRNRAR